MKINACKVITKIWKIDHASAKMNWAMPNAVEDRNVLADAFSVSKAIRININSPAYRLPNNRNANEIGFAIKLTDSRRKLNGIKNLLLKGCKVNSFTNDFTPLILML